MSASAILLKVPIDRVASAAISRPVHRAPYASALTTRSVAGKGGLVRRSLLKRWLVRRRQQQQQQLARDNIAIVTHRGKLHLPKHLYSLHGGVALVLEDIGVFWEINQVEPVLHAFWFVAVRVHEMGGWGEHLCSFHDNPMKLQLCIRSFTHQVQAHY